MYCFRVLESHNRVIIDKVADIATYIGASQIIELGASTLEALEDNLEEVALLGVYVHGFEVVNTEKGIIKTSYVRVQEVTPFH